MGKVAEGTADDGCFQARSGSRKDDHAGDETGRVRSLPDNGMHIIGKAKDQNGTPYFIVKNSWNKYNKFGGYFYTSYPYMALKTMDIMVHKNAIPKAIRKKLGIN